MKAAATVLRVIAVVPSQIPRCLVICVAATLEHDMKTHSALLQSVLAESAQRALTVSAQAPKVTTKAS